MKKILYVEDQGFVREPMELMLKNLYNLDIAENGLQGLELFSKNQYDLIITDNQMPIMSGVEMSIKIREINKDIPIIFTTADNRFELSRILSEIENIYFISKPITSIDRFIELIDNF